MWLLLDFMEVAGVRKVGNNGCCIVGEPGHWVLRCGGQQPLILEDIDKGIYVGYYKSHILHRFYKEIALEFGKPIAPRLIMADTEYASSEEPFFLIRTPRSYTVVAVVPEALSDKEGVWAMRPSGFTERGVCWLKEWLGNRYMLRKVGEWLDEAYGEWCPYCGEKR